MDIHKHLAARSTMRGLAHLRHFLWPARSMITNLPHRFDSPLGPDEFNQLYFIHTHGCQHCAWPLDIETSAILGGYTLCGMPVCPAYMAQCTRGIGV